jgi:hypothetical protein
MPLFLFYKKEPRKKFYFLCERGRYSELSFGLSLNPPGPLYKRGRYFGLCERGRYFGLCERGRYLGLWEIGGDIPRLFSDRMQERIACRQLSENSKTFPPPLKKWGRGGFLFSTSPPSPPLPDKASPSPLPFLPLLADCENPPGPLYERGRYSGLYERGRYFGLWESGEIFWPLGKRGDILAFAKGGDILRLSSDRMLARFRKQQNISPL